MIIGRSIGRDVEGSGRVLFRDLQRQIDKATTQVRHVFRSLRRDLIQGCPEYEALNIGVRFL